MKLLKTAAFALAAAGITAAGVKIAKNPKAARELPGKIVTKARKVGETLPLLVKGVNLALEQSQRAEEMAMEAKKAAERAEGKVDQVGRRADTALRKIGRTYRDTKRGIERGVLPKDAEERTGLNNTVNELKKRIEYLENDRVAEDTNGAEAANEEQEGTTNDTQQKPKETTRASGRPAAPEPSKELIDTGVAVAGQGRSEAKEIGENT